MFLSLKSLLKMPILYGKLGLAGLFFSPLYMVDNSLVRPVCINLSTLQFSFSIVFNDVGQEAAESYFAHPLILQSHYILSLRDILGWFLKVGYILAARSFQIQIDPTRVYQSSLVLIKSLLFLSYT